MATWSALTITQEMIQGIADPDFTLPGGGFDTDKMKADIIESAKRLIKRKVMIRLGSQILQKGGPNAFFDAVADIADSNEELNDVVEEMLVFAFLHQWAYSEHPSIMSRLKDDAEYYLAQLDDAIMGFIRIAPALVLSAGEQTLGDTGTVVGTSSPDYYGSALP